MDQLALLGGTPIITQPFPPYRSISIEEENAVIDVIRSGVLSAFVGAPGEGFLGGPHVRELETAFAQHFGAKHAIAVNSWTSGLIAAIGAIGIEPGDEIIVPPWTMAATATAILHWNGIPVFADIRSDTFTIDSEVVEKLITPRTRAIIAVDIFGHSADISSLRKIANYHGLRLIGDTAQAPGAFIDEKHVGTLVDIGGFSLNYHKHIHCGEGGIVITDQDDLARRVQLIRNHAEAVIDSDNPKELVNMLGYNFRLGEIEAAIAVEQLKKLPEKIASRQRAAQQLSASLVDMKGLTLPIVQPGCTHVYYIYGMQIDPNIVSREKLVAALKAEGVPALVVGYQNLHRLPLFRHRIAYGQHGFPWTSDYCQRDITYGEGDCPVAEYLYDKSFLGISLCAHDFTEEEVALIVRAFHKVWMNLDKIS